MAEWTTVASAVEVPDGQLIGASVGGEDILVVKVGGGYRAVSATCTHAGCSLVDDGQLEDGSISCMCHGSIFDLETGEAVGPPAEEPLRVYQVREAGGEIQVSTG